MLSNNDEISIVICGPVDAGKSSLVGVLTTGELDDGRGKARKSVFHHNHELIWNAGSKYNSLLGIPRTPQYNKKDIGQQEIKKQKQIDWITGCAMMLKTEALKKVGLFRESF